MDDSGSFVVGLGDENARAFVATGGEHGVPYFLILHPPAFIFSFRDTANGRAAAAEKAPEGASFLARGDDFSEKRDERFLAEGLV